MTDKQDGPMRHAYRELATPGMAVLVAGIAFGLMAIVSVLGPMGTVATLTLMRRFLYFGLVTVVVVPMLFAAGFFVLYVARNRTLGYAIFGLALMCLFVVAPCSALCMVLYGAFHDGAYPRVSFLAVYSFGLLISGVGTGFAFYVLYQRVSRTILRPGGAEAGARTEVAAAVTGSSGSGPDGGTVTDSAHVQDGAKASNLPATGAALTPAEEPEDSARDDPAELRLPAKIGHDIVYAHVTGHYVEVVTTAGKAVVYMRLADVVGALVGQGMQAHRSYWVAYRHIVRMRSDGHRVVLHLTDGHRVPVGRSFRNSVRAYLRRRDA